jgi:hypothetical protein
VAMLRLADEGAAMESAREAEGQEE